ncbi:carbamoyltransferase [Methyloprofundus sedimenti]|uniref:Carbamoyltransferase HypF n=1 Tax=Methyloprofundus sedimenti TaxID=1420851 RepID=A0A1V8M1I3_9GAMM|nr:carbamoyltransferase HypF [Methyloprofundus sedimenti]OQK15419.1 carbamoyltransferase [Methyloprofundus sedimenti]
MPGKAIRVRGTVQGVGFRPFIWHLARQCGLKGGVWNDEQGVMIHAWGSSAQLQYFIRQIPLQLPPLANILVLETTELTTRSEHNSFEIIASQQHAFAQTMITADAATCPECLAEINDPHNRRYQYPFTNCTHCGPRLSIIKAIPYDRCNTSMAEFPMCPACQAEYDAPDNRRFHAQANCCSDCGPEIWLEDARLQNISSTDPIIQAALLLQQGQIIAIKGLGGFHLACDANNEMAVTRLRQGKKRYAKPFALMAKNSQQVKEYAQLGNIEQQALTDKQAPIIILAAQGKKQAHSVAPAEDKLGFMLPYTPLHYLLLQHLSSPLVMTSGNLSDEPQCTDNQQARQKLAGLADYFLMHNREIVNRLDDSVLRHLGDKIQVLRRARGFSPEALPLPKGFNKQLQILAMGGELKNSFCLLKDGMAIVSQHIGDLENVAAQQDYRQQIKRYQQLFDFNADIIAVDLHPGYLSTQYGEQLAQEQSISLLRVQHHHAHIAACIAEHGLAIDTPAVLAAVFDGSGMGLKGELWGGEFMLADYVTCQRLGHLQKVPMPGGVQAIREPWRNAYAQLAHNFDYTAISKEFADLDIIRLLETKPLSILATMIENKLNSPLSSSCGRWFDAFAALLGICPEQIAFEGQAAIMLESLAASEFIRQQDNAYDYAIESSHNICVLNFRTLLLAVLQDLQQQRNKAVIAARIHHTLISASVALLLKLSAQTQTNTIVLSGGVFQNKLLLESITQQLQLYGKAVLSPQKYPVNDGGIALGQALIAASIQVI